MEVNLDEHAGPATDPAVLRARREALVDQLGWLADEAEALGPLLAELPAWALEGAPLPGEHSVNETLAHLAALDRMVYPRWLDRLATGEQPALDEAEPPAETGAETRPLDGLLADLRAARTNLIRAFEAAPEALWDRPATLHGQLVTLYDLALRIVRHDADLLRALAYRLHEANLTGRP